MSDWWSKKLGQQQAPAQQQPNYPRPPAPPAPAYQPPVSPVPEQWQPGQGPPQPPAEGDPNSITVALQQDVRELPRQAVGNKQETQSCPGCGGRNFFSRTTGVVRGPAPAPSCFDCGYPLVQSGSGLGSLAGAAASGGVQHAPQAAINAPPMNTIIAHV